MRLLRMARSDSARVGVVVLSVGNALAQAVPLAAAVVLTRLYEPADFGVFGLFVAVSSLLAAVASGRYELAIVVPKREGVAREVLLLTLLVTTAVCVIAEAAIVLSGNAFESVKVLRELGTWIYWVPVFTFCICAFQAFSYWLNRRGDYLGMATGSISLKAASEGSRIVAGVLAFQFNGLIAGGIIGQALGALLIAVRACVKQAFQKTKWRISRLSLVAVRYKKFPMFTLPYSLVATLATESVTIALVTFGYIQAAGFYALTRRVIISPVGLLSSSVGRVFFKEAASAFGTARLQAITDRALVVLASIFAPLWIFFALWAPDLFALIFGQEWRQAGLFAAALSPVAFLFLFTSWPERMYEVAQRQEVSLGIQVVADVTRIVALFGMLSLGYSPILSIIVYAALSVLYHAVYLTGIYLVGNLNLVVLSRTALWALVISTVSGFVTYGSREILGADLSAFFVPVILFLIYYTVCLAALSRRVSFLRNEVSE